MLTHRQKECLDFIEGYIASTGGVAPTFREMQGGLGAKSKDTIHKLLQQLAERGFIRTLPCRARAIEIIPKFVPLVDLSKGQSYFLYDRESEAMLPWTPP